MRYHSIEHKIGMFLKVTKKICLQRPLSNYDRKNYMNVILYIDAKFRTVPCNRTEIELSKIFLGKNRLAAPPTEL